MALEQRCTDLGANCICNEQLNTPTMTEVQSNSLWDPDDSIEKECTMAPGSHDGAWFEYDHFSLQVATSGEMFTALPNLDASIEYLWRAQNGDSGSFQGHVFGAGTPTGRRSLRWYQYFSPTWEPSDGGSPGCQNSGKLWEMSSSGGSGGIIAVSTSAEGSHGIYGWDGGDPPGTHGWNISPFDCCTTGPGPAIFSYDAATMNGKWWRFELAVDNVLSTGGTTVIRTWRKNVTDDEDEELVLDTSATVATGPDDWTSTQATTLKPVATLNALMNVPWRNGTCAGYTGHTHYLAAAWDTAAGQRIGAAEEIEGGGGGGAISASGPIIFGQAASLKGKGRLLGPAAQTFGNTARLRWPGPLAGNLAVAFSISGSASMPTALLAQEGFRWRNDDGDEDGATWRSVQDANAAIPLSTPIRLRVIVNATGNPQNYRYRLEYKRSTESQYRPVTANSGELRLAASSNITAGGENTTPQLAFPAGKNVGDFHIGRMWDDENGIESLDIEEAEYTELEWCIAADVGAVAGDVYDLRVTRSV